MTIYNYVCHYILHWDRAKFCSYMITMYAGIDILESDKLLVCYAKFETALTVVKVLYYG